jgi:GNAT superfamily N-acetyltransferase
MSGGMRLSARSGASASEPGDWRRLYCRALKTSISVATLRDARELIDLRTRVAHGMTEAFGAGHWSARPSWADVVRQLRASRVLVARRDAEIIGTVRLARALPWAFDSASFTAVETALYVLGLAVAPEARGHGVGGDLMEAAKAAARSWPADALWLDAYDHPAGAGAFYKECGFRAVGSGTRGDLTVIYYEWLATMPA